MPPAARHPEANSLAELRQRFLSPHADSRPTPFFWWSGGDLDRDALAFALDQLAEKGIGGTIVGYSQHPDNRLDAGDPTPFTAEWWELLRWFCDESDRRDMVVGVQDYGIIGSVLLGIGDETASLGGGSLHNETVTVTGPCVLDTALGSEPLISARGWAIGGVPGALGVESAAQITGEPTASGVRWTVPDGDWMLSSVTVQPGVIAGTSTRFDPLHPRSGALVIERFYEDFVRELGDRVGGPFRFIFQDELNLGVVMPMFDEQLIVRLRERGFELEQWVHALWHDRGDRTIEFRAVYRDLVVGLLEDHYFRPIFEWHRAHGTQMLMDQLSRGDLRLGAQHYGDFIDVMRWYDGPGNDDPDLTGPRNIAAFKVSSSIANLNDRPFVPNEAFHSSGWGISPADVFSGAALDFAAGANHLILHGLNARTNAGWWEWASPDFHYRQPWWHHSDAMWRAFARLTEFVRAGVAVRDVALIDPSSDVVLSGGGVSSPELAHDLIERLTMAGIDPEVVPPSIFGEATVETTSAGVELVLRGMRYRAVVLPGIVRLRASTAEVLRRFTEAGGVVVTVSRRPQGTELADFEAEETAAWPLVAPHELADTVRGAIDVDVLVDVAADPPSLVTAHRRLADADAFLIVNAGVNAGVGAQGVPLQLRVAAGAARVERWDPWTGESELTAARSIPLTADAARVGLELSLAAGESVLLVVSAAEPVPPVEPRGADPRATVEPRATVDLDDGWTIELVPSLDNRFGDFELGGHPIGVPTWRVEEAPTVSGPWVPALVDTATRFFVLGPVPPELRAAADAAVAALDAIQPGVPVELGGLSLPWRAYRFSESSGIENDPLLLDRMTGPHGLKGVPDEFLDPTVLDPGAVSGDSYYFCSSVAAGEGPHEVHSAGRAEHAVWFDHSLVLDQGRELPPAFFAPWDLRDMSTTPISADVDTSAARSPIAVRVVVADGQPTRVAVWVDGAVPEPTEPALMRWWQGPHPSLSFVPAFAQTPHDASHDARPHEVWLRATVPPGATSVSVEVDGTIIACSVSGSGAPPVVSVEKDRGHGQPGARAVRDPATARFRLAIPAPTSRAVRTLLLAVVPAGERFADAGLLRGPLRWETAAHPAALLPWPELGLGDYSGRARYAREFSVSAPTPALELRLGGLVGTARVEVNGVPVGDIVLPDAVLRIDGSLLRDQNTLSIEVANTLSNFSAHLPSPYSVMQPPSGGFLSARLEAGS